MSIDHRLITENSYDDKKDQTQRVEGSKTIPQLKSDSMNHEENYTDDMTPAISKKTKG